MRQRQQNGGFDPPDDKQGGNGFSKLCGSVKRAFKDVESKFGRRDAKQQGDARGRYSPGGHQPYYQQNQGYQNGYAGHQNGYTGHQNGHGYYEPQPPQYGSAQDPISGEWYPVDQVLPQHNGNGNGRAPHRQHQPYVDPYAENRHGGRDAYHAAHRRGRSEGPSSSAFDHHQRNRSEAEYEPWVEPSLQQQRQPHQHGQNYNYEPPTLEPLNLDSLPPLRTPDHSRGPSHESLHRQPKADPDWVAPKDMGFQTAALREKLSTTYGFTLKEAQRIMQGAESEDMADVLCFVMVVSGTDLKRANLEALDCGYKKDKLEDKYKEVARGYNNDLLTLEQQSLKRRVLEDLSRSKQAEVDELDDYKAAEITRLEVGIEGLPLEEALKKCGVPGPRFDQVGIIQALAPTNAMATRTKRQQAAREAAYEVAIQLWEDRD